MANSAHTTTLRSYQSQPGTVGRLRATRAKITFGADYATTPAFPLITADELGLSEVVSVIPEGTAKGTAIGATVSVVLGTGGANFTLQLWNGTTAVATADESATTIDILVLGH